MLYGPIAKDAGIHPAVLFYALLGWLLALLSGTIALLVWGYKASIYKDVVLWAMAVSASEGLQMNCHLLGPTKAGIDVCDYHFSPIPIGASMTGLYVLILAWIVVKNVKRSRHSSNRPLGGPGRGPD